jgi:hypothetical protein
MATRNFTSLATTVNFEFVRRSKSGGLELVKRSNGQETITPVKVTVRKEKQGKRERVIVGVEPRFVNGNLEVF